MSAAAPLVLPLSIDNSAPIIGDPFNLTASMSGAVSASSYYIKCRIGSGSSSLGEAQTYNSQTPEWLNDTDAWTHMPQISTDSDGNWQGSIQCRVKISAVDESKILYVRACLNSNSACGTSFQSNTFLAFNTILPTATSTPPPTDTPEPTKTPTLRPTATSTSTPAALKPTPASTLKPTSKPTSAVSELTATSAGVLGKSSESAKTAIELPKTEVLYVKNRNLIPIALILIGTIFLIACGVVFSYPYVIRFINKHANK